MKHFMIIFSLLIFAPLTLQAQTLKVESNSIQPSVIPKNGVRIPFLSLDLINENKQSLEVSSLTLKRTGLSSFEDLGRIWAESTSFKRSNSRKLNSDDVVTLNFRTPLNLTQNTKENITIFANINTEKSGVTIGLELLDLKTNKTTPQPTTIQSKIDQSLQQKNNRYDRSKYRIKCRNSRCQLVPRT